LHVVKKKGDKPEHVSFLADGDEDPRLEFLEKLEREQEKKEEEEFKREEREEKIRAKKSWVKAGGKI